MPSMCDPCEQIQELILNQKPKGSEVYLKRSSRTATKVEATDIPKIDLTLPVGC